VHSPSRLVNTPQLPLTKPFARLRANDHWKLPILHVYQFLTATLICGSASSQSINSPPQEQHPYDARGDRPPWL
jgi:hypothetical protein